MKSLLLLCMLIALPLHAGTLRCKSGLLTEGDSSAELLIRCGEPMLREDLTRYEANGYGVLMTVKYAERWTYNFGRHQFLQFVIIRNGIITDIEDGPRLD